MSGPTAGERDEMDVWQKRVAIIGGGLCGFSGIQKITERGVKVTIFEASPLVGEATPFGSKLGAQAMSFNSAEDRVNRVLNRLLRDYPDMLVHLDDGLLSAGILSRTLERPQGWNRSTGQWEHYALSQGTTFECFLRAVGGAESYDVREGCKVEAIEQGEKGGWKLNVENGEVSGEFDAVLIAIPARNAEKLLAVNSSRIWDEHVQDVLLSCANAYVERHTVLVSFSTESVACKVLLEKFRAVFCDSEGSHDGHKIGQQLGMARELDVSSAKGSVALLSLSTVGDEVVEVIARGRKGVEKTDLEAIVKFFEDWLGVTREEAARIKVVTERHYLQARPEVEYPNRPLEPLRERGCVICKADEEDENVGSVVAAGDYAVGLGTVSSAISSGLRAADIINQSLERKRIER